MAQQRSKASTSTERGLQQGMYKNQLQELAQRSCFNLPSYSCIREGPDHAPRFKAVVNFNGETFESPNYCTTLRQAEHAAAEVALSALSKRGPLQTFAARILDETGVRKNLLQETAQKAGVSLPVYTTVRAGPGRAPTFKCIAEVGGRVYTGEVAKTKKQAEKNAAITAWSAIKQSPLVSDSEPGHHAPSSKGSTRGTGRSRLRGGSKSRLNRDGSPSAQIYHIGTEMAATMDQNSPVMYTQSQDSLWPSIQHLQSHCSAMSGVNSPLLLMPQERVKTYAGHRLVQSPLQPQYQRSRLAWQSYSDRYELRRPELKNEFQLVNREEEDWLESSHLLIHQHPAHKQQVFSRQRPVFQSQSERFELRQTLLDELYQREEEERSRLVNRDRMPIDYRNTSYSLFPDTTEVGDTLFAIGEVPFSGESSTRGEYNGYNDSCSYGDGSQPSHNCNTNNNSGHGAGRSRYVESYNSTTSGASPYLMHQYSSSRKGASSSCEFVSAYGGSAFDAAENPHSSSNVASPAASSSHSSSASSSIWSQWWGCHRASNPPSCVCCTPNLPTSGHQDTNAPSSVHCTPNPPSSMQHSANPSSSVHHTSNLPSSASNRPSSAASCSFFGHGVSPLAPPVKVRQIVPVCSAPPSRQTSNIESSITFPEQRHVPRDYSSSLSFLPVGSKTVELLEQLRL